MNPSADYRGRGIEHFFEIFCHFWLRSAEANVPDTPVAKDLIRCANICNGTVWREGQETKPGHARECMGDASEIALLKFTHLGIQLVT